MATYNAEDDVPAAKAGDHEAQMRIVESMEGAIHETAADFAKRFPHLAKDDLEQEGRMAVLRCIQKWNPEWRHSESGSRSKFSTYAYPAIFNRVWIIAKRTRLLSQLDERPFSQTKGKGSEDPYDPSGLDQLAIDDDPHRLTSIECFRGLGFDRCRVLLCRLAPLGEGRALRSWADVSRIENLPVERCKELYEEAVQMVRAAHGEDD
jgi:hypothetical protein